MEAVPSVRSALLAVGDCSRLSCSGAVSGRLAFTTRPPAVGCSIVRFDVHVIREFFIVGR